MKLHPTAGPKTAHTIRASWWSLVSSVAMTTAPARTPATRIGISRARLSTA